MLYTIRTLSVIVLWTTLLVFALAGCGGNGGLSSAGGGNDTTPPTLSNIQTSNRSADSATLTWITDEPADSRLEYGLDINYGSSTSLDANLVATHAVALTGLSSSTLYFYRVISRDASGNETLSGDYSFATGTAHYVRTEATGLNDGTDWTNAHTILPAVLVRGDTYYIADGAYPSYTFNDAESETDYITIKKAIETGHGTDTGWLSSYGDGQASFAPQLSFRTGYFIIDGVNGSGGNSSSYGFSVSLLDCSGVTRSQLISLEKDGDGVSNITISHFRLENCGSSFDIPQYNIYSNSYKSNSNNITISNNYIAQGNANMAIRGWVNSNIENNYFGGNWSSSANHGNQISPGAGGSLGCNDITLAGNIFTNTSAYVVGFKKSFNYRWKIYNNIIIGGTLTGAFSNADSATADVILDSEFYHNTFVNVNLGGQGGFWVGTISDTANDKSFAYNNLFYNTNRCLFDNAAGTSGAIEASNNSYYDCTDYNSSEANIEVKSGDPFVDLVNNNYHLKTPTDPGLDTLGSPYDTDIDGEARGVDGLWDRGAYEYAAP